MHCMHSACMLTTQQRLMCALKNARLLPDGYCCLNNTGNKLLFRINWWCVNQCVNVVPREAVHWCEVCWQSVEAKSLAHPVQSKDRCKWRWDVFGPDMQSEPRPTRGMRKSWHVQCTHDNFCCVVSYVSRSVAVNWYEIQLFFRILQWFYLISNLSQTQFDSP